MKVSAGCLVVRAGPEGPEVLLVHPHRASFKRPLFGIPKGLVEEGEDPETAARRETLEETGLRVRIHESLGTVQQKNGKLVHGYLATVEPESEALIDDHGRCEAADDENDVCRFYPLAQAEQLMIPAQREFLERLKEMQASKGD
jgi:predicted NUDIX family NTP pyrophosphohydrolase